MSVCPQALAQTVAEFGSPFSAAHLVLMDGHKVKKVTVTTHASVRAHVILKVVASMTFAAILYPLTQLCCLLQSTGFILKVQVSLLALPVTKKTMEWLIPATSRLQCGQLGKVLHPGLWSAL